MNETNNTAPFTHLIKRTAGNLIRIFMIGFVGLIALALAIGFFVDIAEGEWAEVAASLFCLAFVLSMDPVLRFSDRLTQQGKVPQLEDKDGES